MKRCWRVFLQLCKILLTRILFFHRAGLFTHDLAGIENRNLDQRDKQWGMVRLLSPYAVLQSSGSEGPATATAWYNGSSPWNAATPRNAFMVAPGNAWFNESFPWTLLTPRHILHRRVSEDIPDSMKRSSMDRSSSMRQTHARGQVIVVPFAKHQFEAVERWIHWNLPLACPVETAERTSSQTVLAFYINTIWDSDLYLRVVDALRKATAPTWPSCLDHAVYLIEARLDSTADRYRPSSWLSERDSAGTGSMFYPLVFALSLAAAGGKPADRSAEPWMNTEHRALRFHRLSLGRQSSQRSTFSGTHESTSLPRVRYLFWCEPDCNAVQAQYNDALRRIVALADARRLWMLGSPLRSTNLDARISWRLQYHQDAHRTQMNGNALYRVGDLDFCRWLWRVWNRHRSAAFDVAIDRQLFASTEEFWDRSFRLQYFAQIEFIHNLGNEPYRWHEYRYRHPYCFFIHGKNRLPPVTS